MFESNGIKIKELVQGSGNKDSALGLCSILQYKVVAKLFQRNQPK